jgi:hypothetical protein
MLNIVQASETLALTGAHLIDSYAQSDNNFFQAQAGEAKQEWPSAKTW